MNDADIVKAFDIIDKFEFFGGQRAGRELWFNKPTDVQNKDIGGFLRDLDFLRQFIKLKQGEIERLKEKVKGFQELWCEAESDLRTARSEAVKEFAERVKDIVDEPALIRGGVIDATITKIDNLVKEMTEGT